MHMYLLLTERERLEGKVVLKPLLLPLCRPSRAKGVGKLFDREDSLRIVTGHFLQRHTSQKSKVIRFDGFGAAKLLELTDIAMTVQHEARLVVAGDLDSKSRQNGGQRIEMSPKAYSYSLKRGSTEEDANIWRDTLQITKDNCIECQEEMKRGIGLRMAAKADRLIMMRTEARITWRSLEGMK